MKWLGVAAAAAAVVFLTMTSHVICISVEETQFNDTFPRRIREAGAIQPDDEAEGPKARLDARQLGNLPNQMFVNIRLTYNNWWETEARNNWGMSGDQAARMVFTRASQIMKSPGLGTTVHLNLIGAPVHERGTSLSYRWEPEEGWMKAQTLQRHVPKGPKTQTNVHHYAFLTTRARQFSFLGYAMIRTVCITHPSLLWRKVSVTTFIPNLEKAGQILAHEVGHAMGMEHDFFKGSNPRRSRFVRHQKCTGIMDYTNVVIRRWSPCSRQDLLTYYNQVTSWFGRFCLA